MRSHAAKGWWRWCVQGRRRRFVAVALAVAGLLGYALYLQYRQGLEPCPLCVFQRMAFMAVGGVALLAALQGPRGSLRVAYGLLITAAAAAGGAVAARHIWLQGLPPDRVPACGPGLDYLVDLFPWREVVRMVLSGSGECAEISWRFLGLSMPAWALIWFLLFAAVGVLEMVLARRDGRTEG